MPWPAEPVVGNRNLAPDEVLVTQSTGAMRADGAKVDLTLVPPELLRLVLPDADTGPDRLLDWWLGGQGSLLPHRTVLLALQTADPNVNTPYPGVLAMAGVLNFGAKKYAPRNWEKGLTYSCCYNSAMRHALKALGGEERDPESGLPHWAHFAWNVMAIYVFQERGRTDLDDREEST